MIKTYELLKDRLDQLNQRRWMIPKYLKDPDKWIGRSNYSLADLPEIDKEIYETGIAIAAIQQYRKTKRL